MTSRTTTFDLEVHTSRKPGEFVAALFERIDVKAQVAEYDGICEITTQFFEISAFNHANDALSHEVDIDPTVFIEFRPKPTLSTDILAIKRLLEAMDRWMQVIDNDFVMTFNGEAVMMYRKDCQLYVNSACRAWTPARLSLITVPYETITVPAVRETTD